MTNTKELRAQMARYGDTGQSLADAMNVALSTISKKINNEREFTQKEIDFIKRRYNLTPDDVDLIFLPKALPKGNLKQHKEGVKKWK
jgi:hypothetical protein